MALLDVTEVLACPDFMDTGLICYRMAQVVGEDGRAVNTPQTLTFSAVVTSDSGDNLRRMPTGEYIGGDITVHTRFELREGSINNEADEILWKGRRYTVTQINNYTNYGRGFVAVKCSLKPLAG